MSFLRAPEAIPDTTCLGALMPVDFGGDPEGSKVAFDRDSAWD
jgi:hypothetical protein